MIPRIYAGGLMVLALACGGEPDADRVSEHREAPASSAAGTDTASGESEHGSILFLGTSLTAGYGVGEEAAYPAIIGRRLDSLRLPIRVVNAGVSGETSAGGLRRIDWLLRQPVRILVLELGANDGLRGLDVDSMRANLQEVIDRTKAVHPDAHIVIAGMQAPPNLGDRYTGAFARVFTDLARENDAALIPFLLDGVAAVPEFNQPDGIHPTEEGHELVAESVWRALEPLVYAVIP